MNKISSHLSSSDFRSTAIARVCLAVAKTNASLCHNQGNAPGVDFNRSPWAWLSSALPQTPRHGVLLQSP